MSTRLRVATYNVRNLFGATAGDNAKSSKEINRLRYVIDTIGADIIALQEVGSQAMFAQVNKRLKRPFPYAEVWAGNSTRGIHLAFLSRLPLTLTSHRDTLLTDTSGTQLFEYASETDANADKPSVLKLQRDLLRAEIVLSENHTLALFNVHLKSKTNRPWLKLDSDTVRAAETTAIARIVSVYAQQHPEHSLVLLGDFNDLAHSKALEPLAQLQFEDPLATKLAQSGANPSTYWPKRRMRIDRVLCNRTSRWQAVDAQIHVNLAAREASDHYPVFTDFQYGD